ncbi:kinesin-related protein 12 [Adelges cooleyi]|uniref:kinesin-related protein 12 n=1 Tax=Adelges cooleyi TaxID=133065 RepID=UPI00217F7BD6|nr:kinesin-related protein 12 [Adelges cooleyi]
MRHVESSENITIMDEIDELLGTRRSYGWNSGSRPSMISAKYRLKEERRKVLKISVNKMKKIDDAESSLCRSVLINNTVKRLQAETRDDRTTGRTSPASPPSPTSYGYHTPQQQSCGGSLNNNSNINNNNNNNNHHNPQLVDITNLRESPKSNVAAANKPADSALDPTSTTTTSSTGVSYSYGDDDDTITSIMMQLPSTANPTITTTATTHVTPAASSQTPKRKRSVDEPLDDLLSQFINSGSGGGHREDEDVNVVDLDLHEYPAAKRLRTDEAAAAAAAASNTDCWTLMDSCCDALDLYGGQVPAAVEHQDVLLPAAVVTAAAAAAAAAAANNCSNSHHTSSASADCGQPPSCQLQTDDHYGTAGSGSTSPTNLSCGQASMFSEMQSAMFRNLIASLES